MTRFVSDGKTTDDLPDFLEAGEHALLDHSAVPGVVSTAGHASIDHTGLPGVGDLTTAAHALLDHTGIPGIGLQGTQVLSAPQTESSLQAALNDADTRVVILLPGQYTLGSNVKLNVPDGKSLIGLSGSPSRTGIYSTSAHAVFRLSSTQGVGSGAYIGLQNFARLANVVINASSSSGSNSGYAVDMGRGSIIENVLIDRWMESGTTTGAAVVLTGGSIARNVLVQRAKNKGFMATNANAYASVFMENCVAYDCDNHGFELSSACTLINCYAYACTGNGFRGASFPHFQKLTNCVAESNSSDGFNYTSSSTTDGTLLLGCSAITNGGWGFNLTSAFGGRPGAVGCCARGNITGSFNFAGWQNLANWSAV